MDPINPQVTVITATWNSSRTLRTTLESLIAQTHRDWEAWVIGDACTDDSEAVVQSLNDTRLHWINLTTNSGSQAFPNNEGLRRARGKYVAYLGHDDLWFPNHLSSLVACIEAERADVAHSICGLFGMERLERVIGPPDPELGYESYFIPPSAWLHRRSLIDDVGLWSAPLLLSVPVDFEYLRRICRAGKRIVCCPRLTVVKIPSEWIRLYALTGDPPQWGYWKRIQTDAQVLERESLGQGVVKLSETSFDNLALRRTVKTAAFILKVKIRNATEDWPLLSRYYRWRFQGARRKGRIRRGLHT